MSNRDKEDSQVLTDIVLNQRIVEHPTKGKIRFRMPTLEMQRKIDSLSRTRKKVLREATDRIPDPEAPNGYRVVPAYKSRQILEREYNDNGWWTQEMDQELEGMMSEYTGYLTQLELLGFDSHDAIYDDLGELREKLTKLVAEDSDSTVFDAIFRLTIVGGEANPDDKALVKDAATTTEVDDLLAQVDVLRRQFESYSSMVKLQVKLMKMEQEKSSLFSDSWQSQLDYFSKLAQVFYCTENAATNTPLFTSVDEMEKDQDVQFITWLFSELNALWQGLSEEARDRMSRYGFMGRQNTEESSSAESPAPLPQSTDGASRENKPLNSIEVSDTKAP